MHVEYVRVPPVRINVALLLHVRDACALWSMLVHACGSVQLRQA